MLVELWISGIGPSNRSVTSVLPSLPRVPRVGSPGSSVLWRTPTPCPPDVPSVCPRYAVAPKRRGQGLPCSRAIPIRACPALRPRWDPRRRPSWRRGTAFRHLKGVGSHDHQSFGALSHGPHAPCVRFAAKIAPHYATLGSGGMASPLPGERRGPQDRSRGFASCYVMTSTSSELHGALRISVYGTRL
jgi:hypothetical protein